MTEERRVISLEEIKERARGTVVSIPDWENKGEICVRLRGIDMTPHLLSLKTIPNTLKREALNAFEKVSAGTEVEEKELSPDVSTDVFDDFDTILPIIDAVVKDCLVEPTFEQFQKEYPLTQMQKMAIFDYAMRGIEALRPFRAKSGKDGGIDRGRKDV